MKPKVYLGKWRSATAEHRFRAMEDELWAEHSGPRPEALDVETSFGPTRAYRWAGTGTPLVFLHGIGGTGLLWAPYAEALKGRDVYALDIMGDVGRSEQRVPFQTSADLAVWADEALGALGIERAHLVGLSLGGFVALDTAIHRPRRVASLVLFDPAGIAPIQMLKFLLWGLPILFGSLMPRRVRRWIGARFRMPLLEDKRIMRMGLHGHLHHPVRFPPFRPFSDDELRSIDVPVVLVLGEKTEMLDHRITVGRSQRLIPTVETHFVADAGHALTVSHIDECVAPLLRMADTHAA